MTCEFNKPEFSMYKKILLMYFITKTLDFQINFSGSQCSIKLRCLRILKEKLNIINNIF